MSISQQTQASLRVNDPVITKVVHGYVQANSVADFVAPVVPVDVRAGKVIKFPKEGFAVTNTRRSRGTRIQWVGASYDFDPFVLQQHARAGAVTEEDYQEAINGEAKVDLRKNAARRAANEIAQSWEAEVIGKITNTAEYEANCQEVLAGAAKFSDPGSDPEKTVQSWKEAVRAQIGIYPNSAVISTDVFNELKFHPIFRDRVKYTSQTSINLDMLATWFDLPGGIRVAQRVELDLATGDLVDMMPQGVFLTFYKPELGMQEANSGRPGTVFMPQHGADRATPSFAYTYQLRGFPIATKERFNEDYRTYLTDVIVEQSIQLTGLGSNGLVGAGFLGTEVV